jgi:WD40 repeat protein
VYGAALSGDGRLAVSASQDKTLKAWDVETGVPLATFTCRAAVFCCAFINDREVIAGDGDGQVYFLGLEESKPQD